MHSKTCVLEDEVAGVVALGERAVFVERFRADGVAEDVVLDIFEGEVALGDGRQSLHPVGDRHALGLYLFLHRASERQSGKVEDC